MNDDELDRLSAIQEYVDMVVQVGPVYHPDASVGDFSDTVQLNVANARLSVTMMVPDLDEHDLTLRVFQAQGWVS